MEKQKCNIIIGRFQPMTIGHIKCAEAGYKENGLRAILCVIITPKEKRDDHHPFATPDILPVILSTIKAKSKYFFDKIIFIKSAAFPPIFKELDKEGFVPEAILCGTDRYNDYKRQANNYPNAEGMRIKCIEIERTNEDVSATKAREALKNNDEATFKKLVYSPLSMKIRGKDIFKYFKNLML